MGNEHPLNFDLAAPVRNGADDVVFGEVRFKRQDNRNGIEPQVCEKDGEKYLRLAVQHNYFEPANPIADDGTYDRCELREPVKLPLGTRVFYGFSLRATEGFPFSEQRCVIAQMKMPFGESETPSPVLSLRIDNGRYLATVDSNSKSPF